MSTRLNVALVAEFDLCEKLAEALEQSCLEIEKLSVVELFPFAEEQGIRFNNKSVAQLSLDETEWSDFDYVFFAGELTHARAHLRHSRIIRLCFYRFIKFNYRAQIF